MISPIPESIEQSDEFLPMRASIARQSQDASAFLEEILRENDGKRGSAKPDGVISLDGRASLMITKPNITSLLGSAFLKRNDSSMSVVPEGPESPKFSLDGKVVPLQKITKLRTTSSKKNMWNRIKSARKMGAAMQSAAVDARMFGVTTQLKGEELSIHLNEQFETQIYNKKWYIILPDTLWKVWWDALMFIALIYCIVILPIRIAFVKDEGTLDTIVNTLFFVDMFLCFFTAFENERGYMIVDHFQILKNYGRGWFIWDLLATFPFSLVLSKWTQAARFSRFLRAPRLFRLFRLLRFVKFVKVLKVTTFFHALEDNANIHPGFFRVLKLIGWVLLVSHASCCIWLSIPILENEDSLMNSWMANSNHDYSNETDSTKYLVGIYWAMTSLTTVGYGDIVPSTNVERVFSMFMMILGVTFYAYSTATVSSVLHSVDLRETINREKMESLRAFMQGAGLPTTLMKTLNQHFRYAWWNQHSVFDTQTLMEGMPSHLRTEVAIFLYNDLIKLTPFFRDKSSQFIASVITNIHPVRYLKSSYIGITGENVQDWHIIKSGVFECLKTNSDTVLMTFVAGTTFGEIGILITKQWVVDVKAATNCEVLAMTRRSMFKVFSEYPSARNDLLNITKIRLKRLQATMQKNGMDASIHNSAFVDSLYMRASGSGMPRNSFLANDFTSQQHLTTVYARLHDLERDLLHIKSCLETALTTT